MGLLEGVFRASAGTLISRPSDRRMPSAILASIGRRSAVADRIADNRVDRTRPIAKIWVNGLSASCDTTRPFPFRDSKLNRAISKASWLGLS